MTETAFINGALTLRVLLCRWIPLRPPAFHPQGSALRRLRRRGICRHPNRAAASAWLASGLPGCDGPRARRRVWDQLVGPPLDRQPYGHRRAAGGRFWTVPPDVLQNTEVGPAPGLPAGPDDLGLQHHVANVAAPLQLRNEFTSTGVEPPCVARGAARQPMQSFHRGTAERLGEHGRELGMGSWTAR